MTAYVRALCSVLATVTAALALAQPGHAQRTKSAFHVSVGSLHHSTDLHPYYATRFDDALVLGGGVLLSLNRTVDARLVIEHATTHLTGGPAYPEGKRGPDNILAGEVQLAAGVDLRGNLRPYVGAGVGMRRYAVSSTVLSDDIVHSPWADAQIQPAMSALAGLGVNLTRTLAIAAEVRFSRARFRAGQDSWGLPRDPVQWQHELRPALRLEVSPW